MGLRGYPGMMGPKGEAVSSSTYWPFFSILLLFGYKAALILRRAPRRHSQTCPYYTNIIHYQQWGHMEMMLTQISPLL